MKCKSHDCNNVLTVDQIPDGTNGRTRGYCSSICRGRIWNKIKLNKDILNLFNSGQNIDRFSLKSLKDAGLTVEVSKK